MGSWWPLLRSRLAEAPNGDLRRRERAADRTLPARWLRIPVGHSSADGRRTLKQIRHALVPKYFAGFRRPEYDNTVRELVDLGGIERKSARKGITENERLHFVALPQPESLRFASSELGDTAAADRRARRGVKRLNNPDYAKLHYRGRVSVSPAWLRIDHAPPTITLLMLMWIILWRNTSGNP
jgi:hypothetical protein